MNKKVQMLIALLNVYALKNEGNLIIVTSKVYNYTKIRFISDEYIYILYHNKFDDKINEACININTIERIQFEYDDEYMKQI